MVPTVLIILPFLAAFVLALFQYMQIDPRRRVLNVRFGLMAGAAIFSVSYPILEFYVPDDRPLSWLFLALALFWLASAYHLARNMPPREDF
jgi:hypothetical protein